MKLLNQSFPAISSALFQETLIPLFSSKNVSRFSHLYCSQTKTCLESSTVSYTLSHNTEWGSTFALLLSSGVLNAYLSRIFAIRL
jgi:hypothetical protein